MNQYLKKNSESVRTLYSDCYKQANTNTIIIVLKTFKMSVAYPELGKEILLLPRKHFGDEEAYFLEKLKEKFGNKISQRTNRLKVGIPDRSQIHLQFKSLSVLNLKAYTSTC